MELPAITSFVEKVFVAVMHNARICLDYHSVYVIDVACSWVHGVNI